MDLGTLFGSFEGRIGRGKWWLGVIILLVVSIVLYWIALAIDQSAGHVWFDPNSGQMDVGLGFWLYVLGSLVILIGEIAICVKRFHDRGKSGWWFLIGFVPIVGFIWFLVDLGILEGDPGPNQYGPPPV